MRLLVDMNLAPCWVDALKDAGFDAAHWSAIGPHGASDTEIMTYAARHDCVVLTHDLDFGSILAATRGMKPSVVQIRSDNVSPDIVGRNVIAAPRQLRAEIEEGALIVVDLSRTRVRLLPLNR
jgi:predicted nuclease of predicted toxin-antitoxin system